jgi:hypothetical protein
VTFPLVVTTISPLTTPQPTLPPALFPTPFPPPLASPLEVELEKEEKSPAPKLPPKLPKSDGRLLNSSKFLWLHAVWDHPRRAKRWVFDSGRCCTVKRESGREMLGYSIYIMYHVYQISSEQNIQYRRTLRKQKLVATNAVTRRVEMTRALTLAVQTEERTVMV